MRIHQTKMVVSVAGTIFGAELWEIVFNAHRKLLRIFNNLTIVVSDILLFYWLIFEINVLLMFIKKQYEFRFNIVAAIFQYLSKSSS